jgi:hypothetical protein
MTVNEDDKSLAPHFSFPENGKNSNPKYIKGKRDGKTQNTNKKKTKKQQRMEAKLQQTSVKECVLAAPRILLEDFIKSDSSARNKFASLTAAAEANSHEYNNTQDYNFNLHLDKRLGTLSKLKTKHYERVNDFLGTDTRIKLFSTTTKHGFEGIITLPFVWRRLSINWSSSSRGKVSSEKCSCRTDIEKLFTKNISTGEYVINHVRVEKFSLHTGFMCSVHDVSWLINHPMLESCVSIQLSGRKIGRSVIQTLKKQKFSSTTLNSLTLKDIDCKVGPKDLIPLLSLGQANIEFLSCTECGWNNSLEIDDLVSSVLKYRNGVSVLRSLILDPLVITTATFIKLLSNFPELENISPAILITQEEDLDQTEKLLENAFVDIDGETRLQSIDIKLFTEDDIDISFYISKLVHLCLLKNKNLKTFNFSFQFEYNKWNKGEQYTHNPYLLTNIVFGGEDWSSNSLESFVTNINVVDSREDIIENKNNSMENFKINLLNCAPNLCLLKLGIDRTFSTVNRKKNKITNYLITEKKITKSHKKILWRRSDDTGMAAAAAAAAAITNVYQKCSRLHLERTLMDMAMEKAEEAERILTVFGKYGRSNRTIVSAEILARENPTNAGFFNLLDFTKLANILNYLPFRQKTLLVTCVSRIFRSPLLLKSPGFWDHVDINWSESRDVADRVGSIRALKTLCITNSKSLCIKTGKKHKTKAKDIIPLVSQTTFQNIQSLKLTGPRITASVINSLRDLSFMKSSLKILSLQQISKRTKDTTTLGNLLVSCFDSLKCLFASINFSDYEVDALRKEARRRQNSFLSTSSSSSSSLSSSNSSKKSPVSTCAIEVIQARSEYNFAYLWEHAITLHGLCDICEGNLFDRLKVLHCNLDVSEYLEQSFEEAAELRSRLLHLQHLPSLEDLDLAVDGYRQTYNYEDPSSFRYLSPLSVGDITARRTAFYEMVLSSLLGGSFGKKLKKFVFQQTALLRGHLKNGYKFLSAPNLGLKSFSKNNSNSDESFPKMEELHFYGFTVSEAALSVLKKRVPNSCIIEFQSYSNIDWISDSDLKSILYPKGHSKTWVRRKSIYNFSYEDEIYIEKMKKSQDQ